MVVGCCLRICRWHTGHQEAKWNTEDHLLPVSSLSSIYIFLKSWEIARYTLIYERKTF